MMSAVEASERLIELARDSDDIANHAGGCEAGVLATVERDVGVTFPPPYRRMIEEFGTWDIAGGRVPRCVPDLRHGAKTTGFRGGNPGYSKSVRNAVRPGRRDVWRNG